MGAILALSSDLASEAHTGEFVLPLLALLFPGLSPASYALLHDLIRKLGHVTEYAVLSALWARALAGPGARWRPRHTGGALLLSLSWAVLDETHQTFVPSRSPSVADVGIDTLGALRGQILGGISARRPPPDGDAGPGR